MTVRLVSETIPCVAKWVYYFTACNHPYTVLSSISFTINSPSAPKRADTQYLFMKQMILRWIIRFLYLD